LLAMSLACYLFYKKRDVMNNAARVSGVDASQDSG
jgi:hypothetical protein